MDRQSTRSLFVRASLTALLWVCWVAGLRSQTPGAWEGTGYEAAMAKRAAHNRKMLDRPFALGHLGRGTSDEYAFRDVLDYFADRAGLTVWMDPQEFERVGCKDVEGKRISIRAVRELYLNSAPDESWSHHRDSRAQFKPITAKVVLQVIANEVDAVVWLQMDFIEIVPRGQPLRNRIAERLRGVTFAMIVR